MKENQLIPISVSLGCFVVFVLLTYFLLNIINGFGIIQQKFILSISFTDILLGMVIYLKTAVDYAIFVGLMMDKNAGTVKRIAMNAGTSIGAFIGVSLVVILWAFFKEISWLMAILLVLAGAVLFSLGDSSQEHFKAIPAKLKKPLEVFFNIVRPVISLLTFFMPNGEFKPRKMAGWSLFIFSGVLPFLLGADDLAGYMALIRTHNIFGLLIGIYLADAFIDIALFSNRKFTVRMVKNRWISYFGALFFVFLGVISFKHAFELIF